MIHLRAAMLRIAVTAAIGVASTSPANAQSADAKTAVAGLAFLLGTWQGGAGTVADTGQTSTGNSTFTSEVGGTAIVRRDHTDLFGKDGKAAGGFDQLMMIYADGPVIRADYTDGTHVIHYASATVVPGRSVTFATAADGKGPAFHLTYDLSDPGKLSVRFEIAQPGSAEFHAIATGTLMRGPR